jgi:hypothetical protein
MGSIYRIGLESIYLIATTSIGVFLTAVILAVTGSPQQLQKHPPQRIVLLGAIAGHGLVLASAVTFPQFDPGGVDVWDGGAP